MLELGKVILIEFLPVTILATNHHRKWQKHPGFKLVKTLKNKIEASGSS
jgi:hypothetical protein